MGKPRGKNARKQEQKKKAAAFHLAKANGADVEEAEEAAKAAVVTNGANGAEGGAASNGAANGGGAHGDKSADALEALGEFAATGVLASTYESRDLKIEHFSLTFHGTELFKDSSIDLNFGGRYGFIGPNGSGKTTMLQCLARREVPIPEWMDIYFLDTEASPTDDTALEAVVNEVKEAVERMEEEQMALFAEQPDSERLQYLTERLERLDPDTFDARAGELLAGLGFDREFQRKATKDMSGGWRMRVALAKALFIQPHLLLLDDPSAHLDMDSTIWLEEYLKDYPGILLLVSHSQDFLNNVCNQCVVIQQGRLVYYKGNYNTYVKTRAELEVDQMKRYKKQQEEIKHHKQFIASCGTFSNLVKQAKSRQKILDKWNAEGLIQPVVAEHHWKFRFNECDKLPPPVFYADNVKFAYPNSPLLYNGISFGLDSDSRIALVGPNGAGKSTLLKLIVDELAPTAGTISRHAHLRFARFHQHSAEALPHDVCALQHMRDVYPMGPDGKKKLEVEEWRGVLGRFGLTGKTQLAPIGHLSDGQRSRLVFLKMSLENANCLILDEPTNALDMESIDSLADALKHFQGGVVLVSHDFRLLEQFVDELWVCDKGTITKWKGTIMEYKAALKKTVMQKSKLFAK